MNEYENFINRAAQMMARIIENTENVVHVHAIAEVETLLADDLLLKIKELADNQPGADVIVYIQRVDMKVFEHVMGNNGAK